MTQERLADFEGLEANLGYCFTDRDRLRLALVHRSYSMENQEEENNERLEFLGDAVLQMVVTDYAFVRYPLLQEGSLARIRAGVVNGNVLAEVAREMDLGRHILLGKGEETQGGRDKDSILADATEAVLAAIYLDGGMESARRVILSMWTGFIHEAAENPARRDPKSRLLERSAEIGTRPRFVITSKGPDHEKTFTAAVEMDGIELGRGEGGSKKEAEQQAAERALHALSASQSE